MSKARNIPNQTSPKIVLISDEQRLKCDLISTFKILFFISVTPYFILINTVFISAFKFIVFSNEEDKISTYDEKLYNFVIIIYIWLIISTILGTWSAYREYYSVLTMYAIIQTLWLLITINTWTAFLIAPSSIFGWILIILLVRKSFKLSKAVQNC